LEPKGLSFEYSALCHILGESFLISLDDLRIYCIGKGFSLSDRAENIYRMIKKNDGCCLCSVEKVMCPCKYHLDEIKEDGYCHCTLFIKDEDIESTD